ncbi:hypothetical protein NE237_032792 [Protea cynaroides]|uniref:Uncharacterized protein n=1 Tax=Protea cynaroides TaxID=273540 RepID=A0A9Q0R3F6_9MAGN|nr:hypothetical protein NE237_032792 [Protea cynaroides]
MSAVVIECRFYQLISNTVECVTSDIKFGDSKSTGNCVASVLLLLQFLCTRWGMEESYGELVIRKLRVICKEIWGKQLALEKWERKFIFMRNSTLSMKFLVPM